MSIEFKCVIGLRNKGALIGNYYCDGYVCAYSILHYVRTCIENYNRNLTNPHIPNEVLAHRFFDMESFDCTTYSSHSFIMPKSMASVEKNYPTYNWPDPSTQNGTTQIALVPVEMNENDAKKNCSVEIWLNERLITTYRLFDTLLANEYCKTMEIDEKDFDKDDLTEISINPRMFAFNELEEVMEVTGDDEKGFKYSGDYNLIYLPKTYKRDV